VETHGSQPEFSPAQRPPGSATARHRRWPTSTHPASADRARAIMSAPRRSWGWMWPWGTSNCPAAAFTGPGAAFVALAPTEPAALSGAPHARAGRAGHASVL